MRTQHQVRAPVKRQVKSNNLVSICLDLRQQKLTEFLSKEPVVVDQGTNLTEANSNVAEEPDPVLSRFHLLTIVLPLKAL